MKTALDEEIEVTVMLYRYALAVRKMKSKPELAGAAAKREIQFKRELEALEAERAKGETLELALREKHEVAA